MPTWTKIDYRDYWDVPRIFFTEYGGQLYLFDCQFDQVIEDYPESYQVFLMPQFTAADYAGSWVDLWRRAIEKLGDVPVSAVRFDPTRRAAIADDVFAAIRPTVHAAPVSPAHEAQPPAPVS